MKVIRKNFTVLELLVVTAIMMILFSMMIHSFVRAKELARKAYCMNSLKQAATVANMYNLDQGNAPYSSTWLVDFSFLSDYIESYGIMVCPSTNDNVPSVEYLNGNTSYHYMGSRDDWEKNNEANGDGSEYGFDASNSSIINLLSSREEKVMYDKSDSTHYGNFNVAFVESSHVETMSSSSASDYWFVTTSGSLNFPEGTIATDADHDRGHGNDEDGVDEDNPGQGGGGPNGEDGDGHDNNGHGNNEDGVDCSNPGQGGGGPNGEEDPSGNVDDEGGNGNNGGKKEK